MSKKCRTLGDLGHYIAGKSGRIIFVFAQLLTNIFVAGELYFNLSIQLQYLSINQPNCQGIWLFISLGFVLMLSLIIRTSSSLAYFSIFSVILLIFHAGILLPYDYYRYRNIYSNTTRTLLFGAPR